MYLAKNNSISANTSRLAFTLVEVLVAVALLGLLAGGSLWALSQANNYASISRLYTGAETAAQNQIDFLLSDSPFNPQNNEWGTKSEWKVGSTTLLPVPVIYSEPDANGAFSHTIVGSLTTSVVKVTNVTGPAGVDLNLYSATVVVTYTFRGKPYRVQFNAMRASDV